MRGGGRGLDVGGVAVENAILGSLCWWGGGGVGEVLFNLHVRKKEVRMRNGI